jgi:hypothetical protein
MLLARDLGEFYVLPSSACGRESGTALRRRVNRRRLRELGFYPPIGGPGREAWGEIEPRPERRIERIEGDEQPPQRSVVTQQTLPCGCGGRRL